MLDRATKRYAPCSATSCDLERGTLSEWEHRLPNRGQTKFGAKRRAWDDHVPRDPADF